MVRHLRRLFLAYCALDEQGLQYRKAIAVAKGTVTLKPVQVGGLTATQDAADQDDSEAANQLEHLAEEQRRRAPEMSKAQAYAKVYEDPANMHLAVAERRAARARFG
jgi:hypothetical protein